MKEENIIYEPFSSVEEQEAAEEKLKEEIESYIEENSEEEIKKVEEKMKRVTGRLEAIVKETN